LWQQLGLIQFVGAEGRQSYGDWIGGFGGEQMFQNGQSIVVLFVVWQFAFVRTAGADEPPLFPNVGPPEVECRAERQQELIPDGAYDLHYFPDGPISILSTRPLRFLMACGNDTVTLAGRGFLDAVPQGKVLTRTGSGPDAHYAGIYAVWPEGGGNRLLAAYHAEDHEGKGKVVGNDIPGFYGTVCLASIDRNGDRAERLGPILTADLPKWRVEGPDTPGLVCQGVGEPHVVTDPEHKQLLCYYTEWSNRKKRHVALCVARSPLDSGGRPGTWKKYHGGRFDESGLGGHDTPILTCARGDVFQAQVTYVPKWRRFVMVFGCLPFEEYVRGKAQSSGIYIATSSDGIQWSEPQRIVRELTVFKTGRPTVQHPTFLVSEEGEHTLKGWLLYAYTPRWPIPHHLVSRPVTIRLTAR
jgi:hypothetical protein